MLRWVMHGEGSSAEKVNLVPHQPTEFERVVTDPARPITLGFAHPWQAHGEGKDRYYYNSSTGESVWDMPPEIVALLKSQGTDLSTSTDVHPPVATTSVTHGGEVANAVPRGDAGIAGYTQLRVEIDRLDFTNPTDAKEMVMMVRLLSSTAAEVRHLTCVYRNLCLPGGYGDQSPNRPHHDADCAVESTYASHCGVQHAAAGAHPAPRLQESAWCALPTLLYLPSSQMRLCETRDVRSLAGLPMRCVAVHHATTCCTTTLHGLSLYAVCRTVCSGSG